MPDPHDDGALVSWPLSDGLALLHEAMEDLVDQLEVVQVDQVIDRGLHVSGSARQG